MFSTKLLSQRVALAAVLGAGILTAGAAAACDCRPYDGYRYYHGGYGNYSCYGGGYDCRYEDDRGYYYHDDYRNGYRYDGHRYNERYRHYDRDYRYRDDDYRR